MKMKCKYCDPSTRFEELHLEGLQLVELQIKRFKYWTIYLHSNQCYLGRCVVKLNRHLEDFFDVNKEERVEFFKIVKGLRDSIKNLFGAELFNYAFQGNIVRHLHLHFIPRHSKEMRILGFLFEDKRWGENYTPYEKDFKTPKKILLFIRDVIQKKVEKLVI